MSLTSAPRAAARFALAAAFGWTLGCADGGAPEPASGAHDGPSVTIVTAPLAGLADVTNACYGVTIHNGDPSADPAPEVVVALPGLCADRFGDDQSAISYVAPCDASVGVDNTVELVLEGLYHGEMVPIEPTTYRNPCPADSPCALAFPCLANEDVQVTFDLTILRRAEQGFLDVAVNFRDVFCSAKYDCDAGDLLFDAAGDRVETHILGFTCAAPTPADPPILYLEPITIACDPGGSAVLDPDASHDGNQGSVVIGADLGLAQWAVYRNHWVTSDLAVTYWNIALGIGDLTGCVVSTLGTTDQEDVLVGGAIPVGAFYPYVVWEVPLDGCAANQPLDLGAADGPVVTGYSDATAPIPFARRFPGAACALGEEACPATSCAALLAHAPGTPDGLYFIDPDGPGGEPAFETFCEMTTDGGGWTLVSVHSDDGQDTWTWNNRAFYSTDRTTFGSADELNRDYKNVGVHDLPFTDLFFVHAPSGHWASYHGVGTGAGSLGSHIDAVGEHNCDLSSGHPMAAGTLTAPGTFGTLCDTDLYFNMGDFDGQRMDCEDLSKGWNQMTYGPVWSAANTVNTDGCPMDDPGHISGTGPAYTSPDEERPLAKGFGWGMGGHTGAPGQAENTLQVFVR